MKSNGTYGANFAGDRVQGVDAAQENRSSEAYLRNEDAVRDEMKIRLGRDDRASACGRRGVASRNECVDGNRQSHQDVRAHDAIVHRALASRAVKLPFQPPVAPMLAKLTSGIPEGDNFIFEPKWDGFRAMIFRDGDNVQIQSRDLKPLQRYLPEARAGARPRARAPRARGLRRRDRHRARRRSRFRSAPSAHSSRRVARENAERAMARVVRRVRHARAR